MIGLLQWCESTFVSQFMRSAKWPFPTVEIFHIAGLVLIFGTMLVLNLRIFGRILPGEPVPQVADGLLPITWIGLTVQIVSGPVLFMTSATKFYGSTPFRLKLLLLIIALVYHFGMHRRFALNPASSALVLRASAAVSMLLWIGVCLAGFAIELLPV